MSESLLPESILTLKVLILSFSSLSLSDFLDLGFSKGMAGGKMARLETLWAILLAYSGSLKCVFMVVVDR